MTITGLVQQVTAIDMWNAYQESDNYRDSFSYSAVKVLHEYYEQLAEDIGEPIEFDYVGIVCEWSEYTERELAQYYATLDDSGVWTGTTEELLDEVTDDHTVLVVETLDTDSIDGWTDKGFKYHWTDKGFKYRKTYLVQD